MSDKETADRMHDLFERRSLTVIEEALRNALDNGHEEMFEQPVSKTAIDLVTYCKELEEMEPEELIPHIWAWFACEGFGRVR